MHFYQVTNSTTQFRNSKFAQHAMPLTSSSFTLTFKKSALQALPFQLKKLFLFEILFSKQVPFNTTVFILTNLATHSGYLQYH